MTAAHRPESTSPWRFCLAPMMRKTDRHFRYLVSLLAPHMRLYTEMITTGAIIHGDRARFLDFSGVDQPVALQLGGSAPAELAACATIAADCGYAEVNLNCGCPSERVRAGAFGACLMRDPPRVAGCVAAMLDAVGDRVAISVKTRLGVDELYSYEYFSDFIGGLVDAGCEVFHVHARKAWLSGLSPAENRDVPPLEYEWVYRLKREYPDATVVVNGGVNSLSAARGHLEHVDGVMLGRHAYDAPYALASLDRALFGGHEPMPSQRQIVERYLEYVGRERLRGTYLKHMSRHLLNFFQSRPGARTWRQNLSTGSVAPTAGVDVIEKALARITQAEVDNRNELTA